MRQIDSFLRTYVRGWSGDEKEGAEKATNLKVIFFYFAKKLEHILQCTDYMLIDDTQLHLFCAHYVYLKLIV